MKNNNKKIHFIDCGANKGQSIQWAFMKYGDKIERIDSFEPQAENFEVLEDKYSDHEKVVLHNVAVWKTNEVKKFFPQLWGARTGSSLIAGKYSTDPSVCVDMECIDLAEWIKKNRIDNTHTISKIDVEGAEYDILPHLLSSNIPDFVDEWFIEFHGKDKTPNYSEAIEKEFKERFPNWVDWNSPEIREEMK